MAEKDREARRARRLASVAATVLGRRGAAAAVASQYGRWRGRLAALVADPKFVEIVADHANQNGVNLGPNMRYLILTASADPDGIRISRDGYLMPPRTAVTGSTESTWRYRINDLESGRTLMWMALKWVEPVLCARRLIAGRHRFGRYSADVSATLTTLRLESGPLLGARIRSIARYISALRLARRRGYLLTRGGLSPLGEAIEWLLSIAAFRALRPRFEAMAGANYPGALDWLAERLEALVMRGRDRAMLAQLRRVF